MQSKTISKHSLMCIDTTIDHFRFIETTKMIPTLNLIEVNNEFSINLICDLNDKNKQKHSETKDD